MPTNKDIKNSIIILCTIIVVASVVGVILLTMGIADPNQEKNKIGLEYFRWFLIILSIITGVIDGLVILFTKKKVFD